ncbi:DNA-processing protein DprA [Heyndrickxia acidicola]|uniref:DNA-processing protein DprA n=1 Tax=Heyndrickxia acidicola TaxID=209389 RepID=A0ABU6MDH9_9BACI|nr:DNA-processing protein DprA [Heyndrickxia acidicola]MED1202086.1 DNA-processing protein DprA [Heyndrickxia acidicola]
MDDLRLKILHLSQCRGTTPKGVLRLLQTNAGLSDLYTLSKTSLASIMHMNALNAEAFYKDLHTISIHSKIQFYENAGISFKVITDPDYPPLLRQIYNPPFVLYTMGHTDLFRMPSIAVVGSRKATIYAQNAIKQLIPPLLEKGCSITSGLAKGVDTMAHNMAMAAGGKTIAVLGSGFFSVYPKENTYLAENMKRNHLIVSEYPPEVPAKKWHFPMRNRIISGLCRGTLVIQAEKQSGSLITADLALHEGREVFAVPGSILDPLSDGTNHLIQQGAKLVMTGSDILEELKF